MSVRNYPFCRLEGTAPDSASGFECSAMSPGYPPPAVAFAAV